VLRLGVADVVLRVQGLILVVEAGGDRLGGGGGLGGGLGGDHSHGGLGGGSLGDGGLGGLGGGHSCLRESVLRVCVKGCQHCFPQTKLKKFFFFFPRRSRPGGNLWYYCSFAD